MVNSNGQDTCKQIDERYQLCESDINLTHNLDAFGSRRINVAIIGMGRMGAVHLYNLLREPRANLICVLDNHPERLEFYDKKYFLTERGIQTLPIDDWQRALKNPKLDAVFIVTPTATHESYVESALAAGKHVFCEKPLAEKPEAVDRLVKLAAKHKVKLVVGFQRRFDPSFRKVGDQIERGDIGPPRIIKTCNRDSPMPTPSFNKTSGGVFKDCFVHDLDLILWYANELPCELYAFGHAYLDEYKSCNDFDSTVVCMRFKSGLTSLSDLSRVGPSGYEQRVEVFGPGGVLKVDELTRVGWEKHTDKGVTRPSQCYSFASRYAEAYANEITELFNQIEGNNTWWQVKPGYLQAHSKIISACEESARASGKPVTLEWTEQEIRDCFNIRIYCELAQK